METGFTILTPQEAKELMERRRDALILDVREEEEYITGHVDEAIPFPLDTITAETAAELIGDKSTPLLVYCRTGKRSRQAARKLAGLGYTQVYDFGALTDWPYGLAW